MAVLLQRFRRDYLNILRDKIAAELWGADVSIFHEFYRPPYGGGNQFLLALKSELVQRGVRVENNGLSRTTHACLFNSFNFDFTRLRRLRRDGCRMIHRVDGPITAYRGENDGTDHRIAAINREMAETTIFQSQYSLAMHKTMGFDLTAPVVIMNAVDPQIFYPAERPPHHGTKVRLISTSWSRNPNKGHATYDWLDKNLDWNRYEYVFVGRAPLRFKNIRMIPAVGSGSLAELLRQHDIYITASLHDPCSNALLEALACGLPAIYADSGGHPEIVGKAGFGFSMPEEVPRLLDQLLDDYLQRQLCIAIPTLAEVTDKYLAVMGFDPSGRAVH